VLVLDEGTAHLDLEKEAEVNHNLQRLAITRINVAHRPEVTSGNDRILWVNRTCQALGSAARSRIAQDQQRAAVPQATEQVQPAMS
jgi:ABC-type bacteriocin/lantibiotic exporter with double-glycine peptidase domain